MCVQTIPNAIQALEPAARIADIMDKKSKIEPNPEQPQELIKPERFTGQIEFRDVRFSYPTLKENRILDGLSFTVEPGTKVALVGSGNWGSAIATKLGKNALEKDMFDSSASAAAHLASSSPAPRAARRRASGSPTARRR